MTDVILPLSHLMSHIYITLSSSACEPLVFIVIIIFCQSKTSQAWEYLWMRESFSLSTSSSSDARTHPGNLSPEQSRMLFPGNFSTKPTHLRVNFLSLKLSIQTKTCIAKPLTVVYHCTYTKTGQLQIIASVFTYWRVSIYFMVTHQPKPVSRYWSNKYSLQ